MEEINKILSTNVCCLCKNDTLYTVKNQRSDASFEFFVHCSNCHNWVGKIDWNGNFSFLKNI